MLLRLRARRNLNSPSEKYESAWMDGLGIWGIPQGLGILEPTEAWTGWSNSNRGGMTHVSYDLGNLFRVDGRRMCDGTD